MTMIQQSLLAISFFLASSLELSSGLDSVECTQGKDALFDVNQHSQLDAATRQMWKSYEDKCELENSCVFKVEPVAATTNLNFERLKVTPQYNNVRRACEQLGTNEEPTSLCTVDSTLTVTNGMTGTGSILDRFTAVGEPVCFPYQCTHRQVDIVHGKPLGCDPDVTECILEAEDAYCEDRPAGAGKGNCHFYATKFSDDLALTEATNDLSSKASMACITFQSDDAIDPVCTSETEPIKISVVEHMRKFEADIDYEEYLQQCYDAEGQTCFMSMAVRMEGQVGFFRIDVTGDYNDYPACLPGSCSSKEKIEHMREFISRDIGGKITQGVADGFRRHLKSETEIEAHKAEVERLLQVDDLCPGVGMEVCTFDVIDFYCISRSEGKHSVVSKSSDATSSGITSASFAAAMGVAVVGGMML